MARRILYSRKTCIKILPTLTERKCHAVLDYKCTSNIRVENNDKPLAGGLSQIFRGFRDAYKIMEIFLEAVLSSMPQTIHFSDYLLRNLIF